MQYPVVFSEVLSDQKLYDVLFQYLMNMFLRMSVQWTSKICSFHLWNNVYGCNNFAIKGNLFNQQFCLNAVWEILLKQSIGI